MDVLTACNQFTWHQWNSLSLVQVMALLSLLHQAITWTNDDLSSIEIFKRQVSVIWIKVSLFSLKLMQLVGHSILAWMCADMQYIYKK